MTEKKDRVFFDSETVNLPMIPLRGLVVSFHGFLILVCLGFLLPCSRHVRDIFNRDV